MCIKSVEFQENGIIRVLSREDASLLWKDGFFGHSPYSKDPLDFEKPFACYLGWEEAMYLQSLGKIEVILSEKSLHPSQLWSLLSYKALERSEKFRNDPAIENFIVNNHIKSTLDDDLVVRILSNSFTIRYLAYHHFRSQGWIIKDGLNYGTDFTLYSKGPSVDHAFFGVSVYASVIIGGKASKSPLNWMKVLRQLRVVCQVKKVWKVCVLEVHVPCDGVLEFVRDIYESPTAALNNYNLKEFDLSRWIPEKNRLN